MISCAHCGADIHSDPVDTTYSNVNTHRAAVGQHTGNIYECAECEEQTLDNFLTGTTENWQG